MISFPIFIYPVAAPGAIRTPSNSVNATTLSTLIVVVSEVIFSDKITGAISLTKSSTFTWFASLCIPWFLWSNSIVKPSLIGSFATEVGAGRLVAAPAPL